MCIFHCVAKGGNKMSIQSTLLEQEAEKKFEEESWFEGLQLLEQAVLEDPQDIELLKKTIFIANELEDGETALRNLEYLEVLIDAENDTNFLLHKSQAMLNAEREQEAVEYANKAIELFETPEAVNHARSLRARANYVVKAYEEAIVDFELVLETSTDWYGGMQALGWSYLNVGRFEDAQRIFSSYIDLDLEQYSDFYYGLGISYFEQKKFEESIGAFTEAIRIDEDPMYYYFRGQALYNVATVDYQKELAIADFARAIELLPDFQGAKMWLGDIHYELGNYEEAIVIFSQMIEENPEWSTPLTSLGWAKYFSVDSIEEYEEVRSVFEKALKIEPGNLSARSGLSHVLYQLEAYEEALKEIAALHEIQGDWARGYSLKGWCLYLGYETLDKYEAAIVAFDKALESNPEDVFTLRGRAFTNMILKNYEESLKNFETASKEHNKLNIAWCYAMLHDYEKAFEIYESITEPEEQTADYFHEYAYVLSEADKEEKAMDIYETAFEHDARSCTYGNYASHLARGEGRTANPVKAREMMEQAYEMQAKEERPCGCVTGKLAHFYLKGIGGAVDETRALELLQKGIEFENEKESFATLYAYCLATGTLFPEDETKAIEVIKEFNTKNNSAHAWYIYAALTQDDIIKEQALEMIEKYGTFEDKETLAKIEENIENDSWDFFYPMN